MNPDFSRLEQVADLVVRRVISEVGHTDGLAEALELAYPFGDLAIGRSLWEDALARHAIGADPPLSERLSQAHARSLGKSSKARLA